MDQHSNVNGRRAKVVHLRPLVIRSPQEKAAFGRLRRKAEKAVDRLIALLDELADDPDLEDGDDAEPEEGDTNFGATHSINQQRAWRPPSGWAGHIDECGPTFATTPHEDATGFYIASPDEDREADDEGDELELRGESDQLDFSEEAVAPSPQYREWLRQRRGDPVRVSRDVGDLIRGPHESGDNDHAA